MEKVNEKALKIMELCLLLNPSPTKRAITGDKPTVFCNFLGHTCELMISIHRSGWKSGDAGDSFTVYLDWDGALENLAQIQNTLETLYQEQLEAKQHESV